jgi:hypothetical protein
MLFFFALVLTACKPGAVETVFSPPPADTLPAATLLHILDLPPAFSPTITPTFTVSATPTPPATETLSPSPSPSQPTVEQPSDTLDPSPAPCLNVLYPLATGRRWDYEVTHGETENVISATVIDAEGNQALVDLFDESNGTHSSFLVNCSDGALTEFSLTEIGFLFFSNGASLEVESTSGLLAPSRQQLEEKNWQYSWNTGLIASGQIILNDDPLGEIELEFKDAPVRINWDSTGEVESVQTPAGAFSDVRVVVARAQFNMMALIRKGAREETYPAVLTLVSRLWFMPYVGLVKQKFTSGVVEVGGYSYPITLLTRMELLKHDLSP